MEAQPMAFIQACQEGNVDQIREFSRHDIDPEWEDDDRMTGLMHACERGHFDAVKCLVEEYEANVAFYDYYENASAFERACLNNHIEIVAYLAERPVNGRGNTALHAVCRNFEISVDVLRFLVTVCDVDVNARNARGETCLMVVDCGSYEKVRFLVTETDVDVNAVSISEMTALMTVCRPVRYSFTDELQNIRCLVEEGKADVHFQNKYGNTALLLAVSSDSTPVPPLPIVQYLVETCHADVNVRDTFGRNALMRALRFGNKEVARYLAGVGPVDANATDACGKTLLMMAVSRRMYDLTRHLVETCHADVNAKDADGKTALMFAAQSHRRSAKYLLSETNADANACDNTGQTVLMYAARGWNSSIVNFLIRKHRVDPTCRDANGDNALRLAQKRFMYRHVRLQSLSGYKTINCLLRYEGPWPRVPSIWKGG